jgi:hypothetical protein
VSLTTVEALIDEYARRYIAGEVRAVVDLCLCPFLAVRRGEVIHMPDRGAVADHFAASIAAYRAAAHVEDWKRVSLDVRHLGEYSAFATAHWNALDADGEAVRDTWTSYHLLSTPEGWRFLSYTNHF